MDPRQSGSFPPPGSQPPPGQPYGQPPLGGPGPTSPGSGPGPWGGPGSPNPYTPGSSGNPYGDPFYGNGPQRPPPSRWWVWLLLGGGGVFILMCCGCVGLVIFGFSVIEDELTAQFQNDPVIQEHLGDVENVEFDFVSSIEETQDTGDEEEVLVFSVEGTKGSGIVIGRTETAPDGTERLVDGVLRLPNGEEYELSD